MAKNLDQIIAAKEADLAKIRARRRKIEDGTKFVVGGAVMAEARRNPAVAEFLVGLLGRALTRPVDKSRVQGLLDELRRGTSPTVAQRQAPPATPAVAQTAAQPTVNEAQLAAEIDAIEAGLKQAWKATAGMSSDALDAYKRTQPGQTALGLIDAWKRLRPGKAIPYVAWAT